MKLDIYAPINCSSIAGIQLGSDANTIFENYNLTRINSFRNYQLYQIDDFPLMIYIHRKTKKILSIYALNGYKGSLNKNYKIGNSISGLINNLDWIFVDSLEGFISTEYPNILIYVSLEDPEIEELNATILIENFYITIQKEWNYSVWKENPRIIEHQIQLSSIHSNKGCAAEPGRSFK